MFVLRHHLPLPVELLSKDHASEISQNVLDTSSFRLIDSANPKGVTDLSADVVLPGDVYRLSPSARSVALHGKVGEAQTALVVSGNSQWGKPGNRVSYRTALTFIDDAGQCCEALVLEQCDHTGEDCERSLLPLGAMKPGNSYTVIAIDADAAPHWFARTSAPAVAQGALVAMADGHSCPVETLKPGDRVETLRGPRELRWIGKMTMRAAGPFAPVRIKHKPGLRMVSDRPRTASFPRGINLESKGSVASPRSHLSVLPNTRILEDPLPGDSTGGHLRPAAELCAAAARAPDATAFLDYYTLLLDAPDVFFANGVGVESLRVTPVTRSLLPASLLSGVGAPV